MATSILPATWDVPTVFRDRLGSQAGRQRHMVADGHLLLILHAVPKPDAAQRVGRFFWRAADGSWTSNELGTGVNAVNTHLDEYEDRISRLDREEEEAKKAEDRFHVLDQLAPVYRASHHMYLALQEARKACPEYREIINLRDRAYEIEREAELLFSGTKTALEYVVARRAEEQVKASHSMAVAAHRLNILAAFFFPIAALTSIFGVNLQSGLEDKAPPTIFLALIFFGLMCGGLLAAFVMRPDSSNESARK